MKLLIALLVTIATGIQAALAAKDVGVAKRPAVEWWSAEDQLAAEHPRLRRRGVRRELRAMRDDTMRVDLRHVKLSLASWTMLTTAAAATVAVEATDL